MRIRELRFVALAIASLTITSAAMAQQWSAQHSRWHSDDSRIYFDYGDPVMASVVESPDGRAADVRITTANSMFSYLRLANSRLGSYFAVRDVTIEVDEQDSTEPVFTKNVVDTLFAKSFEETTSKTTWHAMDQTIALPPLDSAKQYTLHVEVRDDIDRLAMHPQPFPLRATHFAEAPTSSGITIGDIALADSIHGTTAYTSAFGNTYMFSRNVTGSVSFKLAKSLGVDPMVDVTVRQLTNLIDPADTGVRYHGPLDVSDLHRTAAFEFANTDSAIQYKLVPSNDSELWTAIFNVPGEKFQQGKYRFSIRVRATAPAFAHTVTAPAQTAERTQSNEFNFVWQDMPLSLEDPTDAIEPLAVLATPKQIQDMSSGSKQEMRTKLYAFWSKQDPSPATAYNERMATFYKRVDYADFNYAQGTLLNGAMTDRGRVYLLYGPPTNIDRAFIPGDAPTETWTYSNNVQRTFHFEEQSGQNYQLTDITDLSVAAKN
ncbi:MAG TPA: GWxTD domain-containing protein [Candidatus Kapabacteria bacterium]|nr:GWxTD domain-containing protein [Candidatus Kapabacteria bacterium]